LEGKVAIVTGAGSSGPGFGTGKATAILFAREGAKVVLVDRAANRASVFIVGRETDKIDYHGIKEHFPALSGHLVSKAIETQDHRMLSSRGLWIGTNAFYGSQTLSCCPRVTGEIACEHLPHQRW
jgi:NAD(P)-dependent dehydrogenase (short-subunit alcohol dehydrogenase family)